MIVMNGIPLRSGVGFVPAPRGRSNGLGGGVKEGVVSAEQARPEISPVKQVLWRVVALVLGLALTVGALVMLAGPINVLAYYAGYGEDVRVEVTESGVGSFPMGRDSKPAQARVIDDGRVIHLYGLRTGDIVTATPPLLEFGARPHWYHDKAGAAQEFANLLGFLCLGIIGLPLLLLGLPIPASWKAALAGILLAVTRKGAPRQR